MWRTLRITRPLARPVVYRPPLVRRQIRLQSCANPNHGADQAQYVRFSRTPFKLSRVLFPISRFVALYLIYYYTFRFIDEVFIQDPEEQLAELEAQKKKEEKKAEGENEEFEIPDEMPEDALFIPLWFPKRKPLEMFDGSEPEWKSMVAFSRDKDRRKKVQLDIMQYFVKQYGRNKKLLYQIGEKNSEQWKVIQADFDYTYPPHKPLEYERFGLEITDDALYTVTRSMSEFDYNRLKNTILPESIAKSVWSGGRILLDSRYDKIKDMLNERLAGGEDIIPEPETFSLGPAKSDSESDPKLRTGVDQTRTSKPAGGQLPSTNSDKSLPELGSADSWGKALIINTLPSLPKPSKDTAKAAKATQQTLLRTWRPQFAIKAGMVIIEGTMRVEGPRCITKLWVTALYSPQSHELVPVGGSIKHTAPKQLRPRGIKRSSS